jgi:hypothetical protein
MTGSFGGLNDRNRAIVVLGEGRSCALTEPARRSFAGRWGRIDFAAASWGLQGAVICGRNRGERSPRRSVVHWKLSSKDVGLRQRGVCRLGRRARWVKLKGEVEEVLWHQEARVERAYA